MKKDSIFKVFIGIFYSFLFVSSCYFTCKSANQLYCYNRLQSQQLCRVKKWDIKKNSDNKYSLIAYYNFKTDKKNYDGKTEFFSHIYLNHSAAFDSLKILSKKKWQVWYSQKNPNISSIEKKLPYKNLTYTVMNIGIFFYFIMLRKKLCYIR
jgi:hypothetical protein